MKKYMKCEKNVLRDPWTMSRCINRAVWRVLGKNLCHVHARPSDFVVLKYGRVPIKEAATK